MNFEHENVRLPIRFGPKTLGHFSFRAFVCRDHFADLRAPVHIPEAESDLVIFSSIPLASREYRVLKVDDRRIFYAPKKFPRYVTDLTTDFETYLETFGAKSKATLRRKVRKFSELAGPHHFRQFKSPDEICEFHKQARELSRRTYQEKLLGHGLPDTPEFKRKMLELAAADEVRAYSLYLDGKIVAYLYCPIRDAVLYYDFLGYDPEFSSLSVGTVLQYLAFEQLFSERRFRLFDFEEGEGQHKRQFSTTCVQCSNLMVFRPSLKSWTYIATDYSLQKATSFALRLLDKLNLQGRVRRLIR